MQRRKMFTLGDVADILDSALDTGISIVDALAKLSDVAEHGKIDRNKCFETLNIDQTEVEDIDNIPYNKNEIKEGGFGNNASSIHNEIITNNNNNENIFSKDFEKQKNLEATFSKSAFLREKRENYTSEVSPCGTVGDAALQGLPIIEALGDLCNVADNFLNDYNDIEDAVGNQNSNEVVKKIQHTELESIINDKVNQILESFKKLDLTVDQLSKKIIKDDSKVDLEDNPKLEDEKEIAKIGDLYSGDQIVENNSFDIDTKNRLFKNENRETKRYNNNTKRGTYVFNTNDPEKTEEREIEIGNYNNNSVKRGTYVFNTNDPEKVEESEMENCNNSAKRGTYVFDSNTNVSENVEKREIKKYNSGAKRGTYVLNSSDSETKSNDEELLQKPRPDTYVLNSEQKPDNITSPEISTKTFDIYNENPSSSIDSKVVLRKKRGRNTYVLQDSSTDTNTSISPVLSPTENFNNPLVKRFSMNLDENCDASNVPAISDNQQNFDEILKYTDNSHIHGEETIDKYSQNLSCDTESYSPPYRNIYQRNESYDKSDGYNESSEAFNYSDIDLNNEFFSNSTSLKDIPLKSASYTALPNVYTTPPRHARKKTYSLLPLSDRSISQPTLYLTSRKHSIQIANPVMNKLNTLKKVMSLSLSKLNKLHDIQREISLSNEDILDNFSENTSPTHNYDSHFDNILPTHYDTFPRHFQRSNSAPSELSDVFSREDDNFYMDRQFSNSSGGTYTVISPSDSYQFIGKETSFILIDSNDSDKEQNETIDPDYFSSPIPYEKQFHKLDTEIDDSLANVDNIIHNLEECWNGDINCREKTRKSSNENNNLANLSRARTFQNLSGNDSSNSTNNLVNQQHFENSETEKRSSSVELRKSQGRKVGKYTKTGTYVIQQETFSPDRYVQHDIDLNVNDSLSNYSIDNKISQQVRSVSPTTKLKTKLTLSNTPPVSKIPKRNKQHKQHRASKRPELGLKSKTFCVGDTKTNDEANKISENKSKERNLSKNKNNVEVVHKNFLRRKSQRYNLSNQHSKDEDSNDEPLSTRLAALRMQLEEKRRQFEEEKKQKQQAWSQERAKVLKDAFYNINGKENQDPSVTPGVTSWEVHFDNNLIPDDDEQKENKDFNPTGSKPYVSPRDYICQKQMQSKQKSVNDGLWFVGFEEGQEENFLSQQSLEQPTQSSNITQKHQQNTPINTETHTKPKEHLPRTKLTNDEQLYSPSNEKMHNVPYEDQNEFSFKEELAKQEDLMGSSDSLSRLKALRNVTSDMVNRSSHQDTLSEMRRLSLQHNDLRDSRNSLQQERKREDRYSQPQPQPHSKPKPHFQQRSVSYDATSPRQRQLDQQKSHYSLQHDLHKAGQKDSKQDLSVLRSQTSVEHKEYEQQLSNLRSNITDHLQENINNEPQFHANLEPQYHVNTENRSNDQILTYNKLISDENEIHYKDTVSDDHPNANLPLKSSTAYHDLQSASSLKQNFNNELVDINQQANNTVVTDHHFISPSLNKQHGEYLSSNEPREQYNEEFTDQSNEEFTDPTNTRRKLSDNTEIYQQPYKEFSQQSNEIHQTFIQNGSKQQQTNTTYIQNQNGGKQQQTDITYIQNQNGANPQQTDITYIQNQNNNLEHTNQTYIQNNNVQQTFQPPNETHIQGGDRSDDYQYSEHQPVMFNDQYNDNKVPAEEMPLRSEDFSQNHQQSTQANNVHNNRNSNIHNENPHHYKEEKGTLSGLSSLTPTDTNASQNIRREVGELHNAADEQLSTPVKLVPQKDPVTEEEKPTAWALTFGEDFQSPEMTPEQKKKRDRFLRNRIKKQEEEKAKKEAELEKKRKKEERAAEQKLKEEEEQTRQLERLKEAELEEATNQLQQEVYSKRLHEMTYHTTPQRPMSQRLPMRDSSERLVSQPRVQSASAASSGYRRTNSNTLTTPDNGEQNPSQFAEYKGPAMYTKPSGKSNRKIIQNAVMHCCLCGEVNKEAKRKCLEALNQSGGNHFLVLFREGLKFRSVYEYYPETETVTRIYGIGPKSISTKMISKYLKYNSGGKEFNVLDTKHLSIQIDGIMIKKELWEKKPGTTPSKVDLSRKKTTPQRPVNR